MGSDLAVSIDQLEKLTDRKPILEEIAAQVEKVVEEVRALPCTTEADSKELTKRGTVLHSLVTSLEKQRKAIVDPLNKQVKDINRMFAEPRDKAQEGEDYCGDKVSYIAVEIKRKADAVAAIENKKIEKNHGARVKTAEAAGREAPAPPPKAEAVVTKNVGGAKQRVVWDYQILDVTKVPGKFLEVKRGAILSACANGFSEIPGLRTFQKTDTSFS